MKKFYFYKLTAYNKGAPCLDKYGKLLSLAICKPMIRRTADINNFIFGFAANSLHADNRLLYIARINAKEFNGDYFKKTKYSQRGDCIYEYHEGRFARRENALHHGPEDLVHDVGEHPNYERASVLLSDDFRYFGKNGSADYKTQYPQIKEAVENLGIGHRVNHVNELLIELEALRKQVWEETQQGEIGEKTSESCYGVCHRVDDGMWANDEE